MIKRLKPGEYHDYFCAEVDRVLLRLRECYGLQVADAHLDIKAVSVEIRLDGPLPEGAGARLKEECSDLLGLRFGDDWIACAEHYCAVETAQRGEGSTAAGKPQSLWDRLRGLVAG